MAETQERRYHMLVVLLLDHRHLLHLHSFPTRRSSDLKGRRRDRSPYGTSRRGAISPPASASSRRAGTCLPRTATRTPPRSEEHTSELQSRPHLVCRLLLEKKNDPLPHHRAIRSPRHNR